MRLHCKMIALTLFVITQTSCKKADNSAEEARPTNIIFMIGDGMGTAQIFSGLIANKGKLNLDRCTIHGFHKTQSADNFVTDSGAGATAFSIGQKTYNGAIGVDATKVARPTILEMAEQNGLATGMVVTCSMTHATPASFIAHQPERQMVQEIAYDFLKTDIDVFIGGGKDHFTKRTDGKNLVDSLKKKGYQVVDSIAAISRISSGKLAGFTASGEPLSVLGGRGEELLKGTETALKILTQNKKGFFLMVEGSQIDWGAHANDASYVSSEMVDFDKAIGAALDFAARDKHTLVIITADHETGGMTIPSGDLTAGTLEAKFSTRGHTAVMVPVFAFGPGAAAFSGIYENTAVFDKITAAFGLHVTGR